MKFLSTFLILIILTSGCITETGRIFDSPQEDMEELHEELNEENPCPKSCDDGNQCTEDYCSPERGYACVHKGILPCCGNSRCESGENHLTCPSDCESKNESVEEETKESEPHTEYKEEASKTETAIKITNIQYDSPGDDRKKENWNGEWVEIEGFGTDMSGWMLSDLGGHEFRFPSGFVIQGTVRIHSGDGENTQTELYWNGGKRPVWNNDGDKATLKNNNGEITDEYEY